MTINSLVMWTCVFSPSTCLHLSDASCVGMCGLYKCELRLVSCWLMATMVAPSGWLPHARAPGLQPTSLSCKIRSFQGDRPTPKRNYLQMFWISTIIFFLSLWISCYPELISSTLALLLLMWKWVWWGGTQTEGQRRRDGEWGRSAR